MKKIKYIFYCELIAELMFNVEVCIQAASDWGVPDNEGIIAPITKFPELKIKKKNKKFKHLPKMLIAKILDLKILEKHAKRVIKDVLDSDYSYDPVAFFIYRKIYITKIGIKSLIIAEKLRRKAKIPMTGFNLNRGSPSSTLKEYWRNNRKSYLKISTGLI